MRDCISRFDPYGTPAAVQTALQFVKPTRDLYTFNLRHKKRAPKRWGPLFMAEREGFEPSIRVNVYTLSRRAP